MSRSQRPKLASSAKSVSSQDLNESIGFLLNEAARLSRRLLYGRLAGRGIRGGWWYALRMLWEGDGLTQRELAEGLAMTQPSTLEMLRSMENEGLIRLERDPTDRRRTRVHLTTQGQGLKESLLEVAEEATRAMVQRLSPAEEVALRALLRTVRDTVTDTLGQEPQASALDVRRKVALEEKSG